MSVSLRYLGAWPWLQKNRRVRGGYERAVVGCTKMDTCKCVNEGFELPYVEALPRWLVCMQICTFGLRLYSGMKFRRRKLWGSGNGELEELSALSMCHLDA